MSKDVTYTSWEYSGDQEIEFSAGSGDLSIDHEGAIHFVNYGGGYCGDFRSYHQLNLEQAIELSVLLTSRIIPYLEEKENANSKED